MTIESEPKATLTLGRGVIAVAIGLVAGFVFVLIPYASSWLLSGARGPLVAVAGFNAALTMLFPLVQGFVLGLALGPKRYGLEVVLLLVCVLVAIETLGAFVFLREGFICLIILAPLTIGMVWGGAMVGRIAARRQRKRAVQVSVLPLVALVVLAEAFGPAPEHRSAVADSVVVNAPPEYIWRYIVEYPENNSAPQYWLWAIGLPHPTQSVAEAPAVGATRQCKFSTGIAFEERILELTPNEVMTFEVTRQPDHPEVTGHFQFDRGQIRLTPNPNGTTTVTATSWYRLFVRPAAYFDWWTADITRNVHVRVLNHVKGLAERDYQRDSAR